MKIAVSCHCGEVCTQIGGMTEHLTGGLAELHEALGMRLLAMVRMGFERETSPDGTPWAPLAPATVKRRKGQTGPILRVNGDLYRSITVQADATKAVVGTNWRYARIHQLGGMAGRGRKVRIPARPYLFSPDGSIPERWRAALERMVQKFVEAGHA